MKKSIMMATLGLLSLSAMAQDTPKEEGFIFTTVKENPITSIKNQNRAGTCWCYSGLAFIESELLRMGKGEYDFSEMFIVHNTYLDRADRAVRTHGDVSFAQGGSFYDVIYGMKTRRRDAPGSDVRRHAEQPHRADCRFQCRSRRHCQRKAA